MQQILSKNLDVDRINIKLVPAVLRISRLPLILLQKEPIGEYWKPAKSRFYAYASGHLLILAPWVIDVSSDYASFHQLNDYAREICEATEMRIIDYPDLTRT